MTTAGLDRERFDMGRVVGRTFGAIGRNVLTFVVLALALYGLPSLVLQWLQIRANPALASPGAAVGLASSFSYLGLTFAVALVNWILSALLQAAVVHGVVADADGRRASIGDCLATGLKFALPVAGVGLVSGIGITLASILLLVPGLILMTVWSVAVPAAVAERTGVFGALSRSGDLTRGHRWSIFGLALVFFIVAALIGFTALSVGGGLNFMAPNYAAQALSLTLPRMITSVVSGTVVSIISSAGIASIYFELRSNKEGIGPSALASVFD